MSEPNDLYQSVGVCVTFAVTAVVNGLVSSGITVPLTNPEIADTHPTYIVPAGYAFSIWGVIYLLVGVYTLLQVLPSQRKVEVFRKARPVAALANILNIIWLYCFSFELFWVSAIVILGYAASLLKLITIFDLNYLDAHRTWQEKLGCAAFSANGAWVCVATALQVCLNMTDEGWLVSADFVTGMLFTVTLLACYNVWLRTDLLYAFVSAWALGGIISNQGASSKWGTWENICIDKCVDETLRICKPGGLFNLVCKDKTNPALQVVPKSPKVIAFCWVCIGLVLVALVAGVVKGVMARRSGVAQHNLQEQFAQTDEDAGIQA